MGAMIHERNAHAEWKNDEILSLAMLTSNLKGKSNARPSRPGRVKVPILRSKNPIKCPGMPGGNGGVFGIFKDYVSFLAIGHIWSGL